MKKLLFFLFLVTVAVTAACARTDKPISFQQLPQEAQEFVTMHFADHKVAMAKEDTEFMDNTYEVIFTDGSKIEFDRRGQWKEIDCKYASVPEGVLPSKISEYLGNYFEGRSVQSAERDRHG